MKKQLCVALLLIATGMAYGACTDIEHISNAVHSIKRILAEEDNFRAAPGESVTPVIQDLYAAQYLYQSGNIAEAVPYLMAAKEKGLSVTVAIPGKGEYKLSQMITAIFFNGDPFAPMIK